MRSFERSYIVKETAPEIFGKISFYRERVAKNIEPDSSLDMN